MYIKGDTTVHDSGSERRNAPLRQVFQQRTFLSLELADYSEVDILGVQYKPVNFGAERSHQTGVWAKF